MELQSIRSANVPVQRHSIELSRPPVRQARPERSRKLSRSFSFCCGTGADPSIKNKSGKTPLDYARDEEVMRLLKSAKPKGKAKKRTF
jgi:hypothetical protein